MGETVHTPPEIIDPALLWTKYNLRSTIGISASQYLQLSEGAYQNYDHEMPAHNFDHAMETADWVMMLADRYETPDIPINRRLLFAAALLHDIRYHEDHTALGFDNKEAYSADAAAPILRETGFSDDEITAVQELILSTAPDAVLDSVEKIILFEADLSSVGEADEDSYDRRTSQMEAESRLMRGPAFKPLEHLANNAKVLAAYATKDISFGNLITPEWLGRCLARTQARVESYARESGLTLEEAVAKLDSPAVEKLQAMVKQLTRSDEDRP